MKNTDCLYRDEYKILSDKVAEQIDKIVENKNISTDEVHKKIESIVKEVKFAAFSKTRVRRNKNRNNYNDEKKESKEEEDKAKLKKTMQENKGTDKCD